MDNVNIGIRHDQSLDSQDDNVGLSNDGLNNRNGDDAQNNSKSLFITQEKEKEDLKMIRMAEISNVHIAGNLIFHNLLLRVM